MMDDNDNLFGEDLSIQAKEWQDMPEYSHEYLLPFKQLIINFTCTEDMMKFAEFIGKR